MKPLVLKMKAFGSYAEETTIDFNSLGTGLYLVTGDTGAGKTTIFDAIVFALYGDVSGNHRSVAMMHTDFLPLSEDTVVTLEFEVNGETHTVTRKIHYPKSRESNGFGKMSQTAEFKESGKLTIKGTGNVTDRITELTGLTSTQFQQIIMLAQGEFRKFLDSDSEERGKILGKLFDSSPYANIQNYLYDAEKKFRDRRNSEQYRIETELSAFVIPDEVSDTERAYFSALHPQLTETMNKSVCEIKKAFDEKEKIREEISKKISSLVEYRTKAQNQNNRIDEKEKALKIYNALLSEKDTVTSKEINLKIFEKSYHGVFPYEKSLKDKNKEKEQAWKNLSLLKSEEVKLQDILKIRIKESEEISELDKKKTELTKKIGETEKIIPDYNKLESIRLELKKLETEEANLNSEKESLENSLKKNKDNFAKAALMIEKLSNAGSEFEISRNEAEKASKTLKDITSLDEEIKKIIASESELDNIKKDVLSQNNTCRELSDKWNMLNQKFLNGQAAVLEKELKLKISEEGKAVCPVCHCEVSCIDENNIPDTDNIPEKSEIDAAWSMYNKANEEYNKIKNRADKLSGEISVRKNQIITQGEEILGDCSWDILADNNLITEKISSVRQKSNLCHDRMKTAEENLKKFNTLTEGRKKLEPVIAEEENKLKNVTETLSAKTAAVSGKKSEMDTLRKQLSFESQKDALAFLNNLKKSVLDIEQKTDSLKTALKSAEDKCSAVSGKIETMQKNYSDLSKATEQLYAEYTGKISEYGFESENEYHVSLSQCGTTDPEKWISECQNNINEYSRRLHSASEMLKKLEEETSGFERVDTTKISEEITTGENELKSVEQICRKLNTVYTSNKKIYDDITQIKASLEKSQKAYDRIKHLSDIVNGTAGEGGKLKFERYVIGSVFREIVEQANYRLIEMSGGKFELVHRIAAARKNSAAGLELSIQSNTGTQRESGSVSGGEAFMVSLSLALGLSDVVKNHAGGIKMDSMFIDEGFGSLDGDKLDKAMNVLSSLAGDSRQIGIISHVEKLGECIPKKLLVKGSDRGSSVKITV